MVGQKKKKSVFHSFIFNYKHSFQSFALIHTNTLILYIVTIHRIEFEWCVNCTHVKTISSAWSNAIQFTFFPIHINAWRLMNFRLLNTLLFLAILHRRCLIHFALVLSSICISLSFSQLFVFLCLFWSIHSIISGGKKSSDFTTSIPHTLATQQQQQKNQF